MSNNIKDYLHLYLGCEVIVTIGVWKDVVGRIGGVDEDAIYMHKCNINFTPDEDCLTNGRAFEIKQVKPILRPLSDMTEDEIKELFKYEEIQKAYSNIRMEREVVMNNVFTGITIHYDTVTPDGTFSNSWTLRFSSMNAHDFKWLLSKGFDLFGLIDADLAIDKTKML